jgi:hypothetical protein
MQDEEKDKPDTEQEVANVDTEPIELDNDPESTLDQKVARPGRFARFKTWYGDHKKLSVPLSIILLLIIVFGVPVSRYATTGVVLKRNVAIEVKDSDTKSPVSGAEVSWQNQNVVTDANGRATLYSLKPGPQTITISKKYYKDDQFQATVPILKSTLSTNTLIQATGRQVEIKAVDYVDGSVLSGVDITVADTTAKTKKDGTAIVVVPVGDKTQKATLSLSGYNNKDADINVSGDKIEQNTVRLTPSGKIYFFSKRTGNLDLMKSDIDGSNVATVLPASGYEQTYQTAIYQSPDWKYVGVITKRSASDDTPQLYVISTDDDQLISVDNGKANFSIDGWDGDTMIYTVSRTDLPGWQGGQSKLKSYNANNGKITLLDQTQGSDAATNINEIYNNVIVSSGTVTYSKYWGGSSYQMSGKQNSVQQIDTDGQNHKVIGSYDASSSSLQIALHNPTTFYISVNSNTPPYSTTYYQFSNGGTPKQVDIDPNSFYANTMNYYPSPSGKQLLWTEQRDGKNAILIGDQTGGNPSLIASYAEFAPYGWFSDKYLILNKNSNELYIVSAKGGTPQKITDYQSTNYFY